MSKRIVLTVSTETDETIQIDGESYGFVSAEALDFKDTLWLSRVARKIKEAQDSESPMSDEDIEERVEMIDRGIRFAIPDLPDEVFAKLRGGQKLAIFSAFMHAAAPIGEATAASGTESSPDSSASTEAAAPSGSEPQPPASGATST
jgi:hypothetical protein